MTAPGPPVVVWDLGNVVIPWDRRRALAHVVDAEDLEHVVAHVFDMDTNLLLDSGAPITEVAESVEARHPGRGWIVEAYVEHFRHSLGPTDPASAALIDELLDAGVRCVGLSNWSAVCWEGIVEDFPVIARLEGVVISGHERVCKPDEEIYRRCERAFGFAAGDALFLDDSAANVAGARRVGWDAELFTGPAAARTALVSRGLLPEP